MPVSELRSRNHGHQHHGDAQHRRHQHALLQLFLFLQPNIAYRRPLRLLAGSSLAVAIVGLRIGFDETLITCGLDRGDEVISGQFRSVVQHGGGFRREVHLSLHPFHFVQLAFHAR